MARRRNRLLVRGSKTPFYASTSATFVIGREKGCQKRNRIGACATLPENASARLVDDTFWGLRCAQMGGKQCRTSGTKVKGGGRYQGRREQSISYVLYNTGDVPGEQKWDGFKRSMVRLAESLSRKLCQDSVMLILERNNVKQGTSFVTWLRPSEKVASQNVCKP